MRTIQPVENRYYQTWLAEAGSSLLRITLLFGFAVGALTLVLLPVSERDSVRHFVADPGIEFLVTGSISSQVKKTPPISLFPDAVCIISSNGDKRGNC